MFLFVIFLDGLTDFSKTCPAPHNHTIRPILFWLANDLPPEILSHLKFSGCPDTAINSSFKLGSAAQTSIGLSGLAAAYILYLRTGNMQDVSVNARHAILDISSESWYTVDGQMPTKSMQDYLAGIYRTKDNSFVRLHTNFPHHRQGILNILQCDPTREAVQAALLQWNAKDFEDEAVKQKMCVSAYRSFEEWDKHPHAAALRGTPPGIRVLDLCRVLSGPVCGRALAAYGADVLLVTSPNLPDLPVLDIDTSRGKRTTQLDLTQASQHDRLKELVEDADVFLQAYRPSGLQEKGFGSQELARVRPGIVCANLTAYGWEGPWKHKRGFDSLVQTATGFNWAESEAFAKFNGQPVTDKPEPRALPVQALDHVAGSFLAFGIQAAIAKTITEGGSWEVRVSQALAAVAQWLRSLGQLPPDTAFGDGEPLPKRMIPPDSEVAASSVTLHEATGDKRDVEGRLRMMTAIRHAAQLSVTPVKDVEAPMGLNRHQPVWLPRA
ncbi:CoA-transferase family III [Suillus bovinus]|uniref:CoA-transferase family III n=1 Tax=Suillus bovinus TaxID=48563 RepID=UPI001B867FE0|nr:CoA-transferase family III [Suillus bovinus]KAG2130657.1 CoA-transferase family III [Suillus bovinus]